MAITNDAFVIVEYAAPTEGAVPNHCRAAVAMSMRFSVLTAHISKNMRRQLLIPEAAKIRYMLVEFRTVTQQHKPTEHVIWIRATCEQ